MTHSQLASRHYAKFSSSSPGNSWFHVLKISQQCSVNMTCEGIRKFDLLGYLVTAGGHRDQWGTG